MNTTETLSYRLFGKNVSPHPSLAWFHSASEEEIATWQAGSPLEPYLLERLRVQEEVKAFTKERMEELAGERHEVGSLLTDYQALRQIPIASFTQQPVRYLGGKGMTRCVFHDDRHPSCVLYGPNGYFCFSCQAGGNAIDWAMQEFSYDFPQAVAFLERYI